MYFFIYTPTLNTLHKGCVDTGHNPSEVEIVDVGVGLFMRLNPKDITGLKSEAFQNRLVNDGMKLRGRTKEFEKKTSCEGKEGSITLEGRIKP